MPSRAHALTPSATPTAPLLMKKASSPPVSALAGCGMFTPPASKWVAQAAVGKALVRDYYSRASLLVAAHAISWHVSVGDAIHKVL